MSAFALAAANAQQIRVDNFSGGVSVRIAASGEFGIEQSSPDRAPRPDDCILERPGGGFLIVCDSADGARVDLALRVPFGAPVSVRTRDGKIVLEGFPAEFSAHTETGEFDLAAPWDAVRFLMFAAEPPKTIEAPRSVKFRRERSDVIPGLNWIMQDRRADDAVVYGRVRLRAERSKALRLRQIPIPADSPVKMAWQAEEIARQVLSPPKPPEQPRREKRVEALSPASTSPSTAAVEGEEAAFSSDVRLVQLSASVRDGSGRPLPGLGPEDFEVLEDGRPQRAVAVESEEAPFNLVLLFDLSESTRHSRDEMKRIARGFLSIARPRDRVAVYVLANNWFGVVSRLTEDRALLERLIDELPPMSGASPVYDSIVLAWAEELAARPGERSAIVAITDGEDNRFAQRGLPSKTSEKNLAEFLRRVDTLFYPVFVGPQPERLASGSYAAKAYSKLADIAGAAGGAVFAAEGEEEFAQVYRMVEQELRSVYSISYYPENQEFDGAFRRVEIRVARPGAEVRARDGYFAR